MRRYRTLLFATVVLSVGARGVVTATAAAAPGSTTDVSNGEQIFKERCSICHDHPQDRIPPRQFIASREHAFIVHALTAGVMRPQATGLTTGDIEAVASYLNASISPQQKQPALAEPDPNANRCAGAHGEFRLGGSQWNGWSPQIENLRYQARAALSQSNVPNLQPKWVFAYPGGMAFGPPSVAGGRVFLGTTTGRVMSLDAKTGCTHWVTSPGEAVHTAITIGRLPLSRRGARFAAYFGDGHAVVHAVNAETGQPIWKTRVEDHTFAGITGTPVLHGDRLYVPLTSGEGSMGPRGDYPCCTFRGSMVALDAVSGQIVWKSYTISRKPAPFKLNAAGTQMYGPAGVGIWSPPTIDIKRGVVYGATAESKTALSVDTSDAIMAFDLSSGRRRWVTQTTPRDNWIQGCEATPPGANCPDPLGPDADFASPAVLSTLTNGKQILVAGQKSGLVSAFDPDAAGKIIWQKNFASEVNVPAGMILRDREQPGVVYGMASDGQNIYVALSDPSAEKGHIPLGVYALNLSDGRVAWHTPGAPVPSCSWGETGCTGAQHTAVTVIPGVAFAGSANGHILAYETSDGRVIWDFDTSRSYTAVNGVKAVGGSIEGAATAVAEDTLYVMSGYASYGGGLGNALIAFTVNGR